MGSSLACARFNFELSLPVDNRIREARGAPVITGSTETRSAAANEKRLTARSRTVREINRIVAAGNKGAVESESGCEYFMRSDELGSRWPKRRKGAAAVAVAVPCSLSHWHASLTPSTWRRSRPPRCNRSSPTVRENAHAPPRCSILDFAIDNCCDIYSPNPQCHSLPRAPHSGHKPARRARTCTQRAHCDSECHAGQEGVGFRSQAGSSEFSISKHAFHASSISCHICRLCLQFLTSLPLLFSIFRWALSA
jgi:hypothetical protein